MKRQEMGPKAKVSTRKVIHPELPKYGAVFLETEAFAPKLYHSIFTASQTNSYSMAIEYMKDKFIKSMPNGFFKTIHINGKHVFDDFKKWNKDVIIKESNSWSRVAITPQLVLDDDNERLDLYNAGNMIYLKYNNVNSSFFKDYIYHSFINMRMRLQKMNFNFRFKVNTRVEQMDLYRRLEMAYRIGGTQKEYISCEFNLPYALVLNLADIAGFEIIDNEIQDPIGFLSYLNQHSDIPMIYKFRAVNGHNEFFIRLNDIYCHITTSDKLDADDGEKVGMLDSSYHINMQCILKMAVPHFFALYNQKELKYRLRVVNRTTPSEFVDMYSMAQFSIPNTNDQGWNQVINTTYELEPFETKIDMGEIFKTNKTEDIQRVIDWCLENYISPRAFIDMQVYMEQAGHYMRIPCGYHFQEMKLELGERYYMDDKAFLYIGIYIDMKFLNETLITINDYYKSRLNRKKDKRFDGC